MCRLVGTSYFLSWNLRSQAGIKLRCIRDGKGRYEGLVYMFVVFAARSV